MEKTHYVWPNLRAGSYELIMHVNVSLYINNLIVLHERFDFFPNIFTHLFLLVTVQFSCSVVSNSLWPHGLQHDRPPCPSPTPGAYSNSFPLLQWCHSTISFFVIPFSSHLQSFPASGYFQMSQLFTLGGQSIGVSASKSILPRNTQDWSPLGWTGGSPCSARDSQESSPTSQFKSINSLALRFLYHPTLTSIHGYWKNHSLD